MRLFVCLIVFFLTVRLYPIQTYNFPFGYDNAKDSLSILQFWIFKKPPLLGSVTSLEGLYQGPLWYYFFTPFDIFMGFHPFAHVIAVIFLGGFTLWLFWRFVGKFEALVYSLSFSVITTHQTAWAPYLAMFSTAWVIIILNQVSREFTNLQLIFIALSLSLLFHSEIAFGPVFILFTLIVLFLKKVNINLKQIAIFLFVFLLPFLPQAIFELRHNFIQTHSVIRFLSSYQNESQIVENNATGFGRLIEVISALVENGLTSIFPFPVSFSDYIAIAIMSFGILITAICLKTKDDKHRFREMMVYIIGSLICYLILPFKAFYLVGLTPIWIIVFGLFYKNQKMAIKFVLIITLITVSVYRMFISRSDYALLSQNTHILFEPRRQAVEMVYMMAQNSPFTSYQYVPEVYDYTYQHIYQYTALQSNRPLPIEYSYAPGKNDYMQTQKLVSGKMPPKYRFLIVESDNRPQFFSTWWQNLTRGKKLINEVSINKAIKIYQFDENE